MALFFGLFSFCCIAQKSRFWDRVQYGGGLGIGFGNGYFSASVLPSALYRINPYFATGIGLSFNYSKFQESTFLAYGASVPLLFNPVRPLQLSAEFEQLRVNREYGFEGADTVRNYWVPALFAGVGYTNGGLTIGLRYDLLHDREKSLQYEPLSPFIRFYF
ncbi:MAG: alpha-ketoglutarate decarboxylase [Sediminicola sp.]